MEHKPKNYDHLMGNLKALSEKQVGVHLELYRGYVKKLNEIENLLKEVDPNQCNYSYGTFSELKRREAVPFNGAYLHELYFDNLNSNPGNPSSELTSAIEKSFGSYDRWVENLVGTAMTGPGWALLTKNRVDGSLHNYFIMEHHRGLPVHQDIVLVMDSWEHAFMVDYGNGRANYVRSVLEKDVCWSTVSERFADVNR